MKRQSWFFVLAAILPVFAASQEGRERGAQINAELRSRASSVWLGTSTST